MSNCRRNFPCVCISVILGIIFGIIIGLLFINGLITAFAAPLMIMLAFAAISILGSLAGALANNNGERTRKCVCGYGTAVLISALSVIILSMILSALGFIATTAAIVLFSLISMLFMINLVSFFCFASCMLCNTRSREND